MPTSLRLPFSGSKLQTTRELAGLSRTQLANRCADNGRSVTVQQLRRIEIGESKPRPQLLKALVDSLEIEVDDLLDGQPAGWNQAS